MYGKFTVSEIPGGHSYTNVVHMHYQGNAKKGLFF